MSDTEDLRRWCIDRTFTQGLITVDDAIAEARKIEAYVLGNAEVTDEEIRRPLRQAMFDAYTQRPLVEQAKDINAKVEYLLTGKVPEEVAAGPQTEAAES